MRTTSAKEIREWIEYEKLEPFGDEWRMVGVIVMYLVALHAGKESKAEDFMPLPKPDEEDEETVQTPEQAKAAFASAGIVVVKGNVND